MARLLLLAADHAASTPGAAALALLVVAVLVVAAVLVSLCTSSTHAKMWGQQSAPVVKPDGDGSVGRTKQHLLSATLSGIGDKAARMVSWNRRAPSPGGGGSSDGEEAVGVLGLEMEEEEEEEAVWRKAILMGDKCRPLQFSGHIAFDSDGNQLPAAAAVKKIAAGPDDVQVKN